MDPFSRRLASLSASLRTGAAVGAAAAAGDEQQEIVIIVGGGPGISGACARLFAEVGMLVAIAQRTPEKPAIKQLIEECPAGRVHAYQCDASDADSVAALFEAVQRDHAGRIRCVVYNPSGRARGPVVELDPEEVKQALLVTAYGGFLVGQKAAQTMLEHGQGGSILFTGASASYKGYPNSSSFAMGKFGLTGMAQSMARELAPQGIHVAHFPIDGGVGEIDYSTGVKTSHWSRYGATTAGDREELASMAGGDGEDNADTMLGPDHIAETYLFIHRQHRSAWTFEMVLRPWVETW